MDEARLIEKLARIEALFAGATTEGERDAAAEAKARIERRLADLQKSEPPIVMHFSVHDPWARRMFLALARRYGLDPYRRRGQRRTTVLIRAPRRFIEETFWPEFQELERTLRAYLEEVTERVIAEVVHGDASDAPERAAPPGLPRGEG
jgi:hypothetical protein